MQNKFNTITPLSKILAIILFLGVLPVLCFYIGTKYQEVKDIKVSPVVEMPVAQKAATSPNQTFTFAQDNISFQYPSGYSVDGPSGIAVHDFVIYKESEPSNPEFRKPAVQIHVMFADKDYNFNEHLSQIVSKEIPAQKQMFGTKEWIVTGAKTWAEETAEYKTYYLVEKNEDGTKVISVTGTVGSEGVTGLVLNTFK